MFCPNCGNKIEDDAKFCENCGAAINNKSETVINENLEQNTVVHTSKKKIVVIVIISFIVLLIAGIAAYFIHEEIQIKRGADEILSLMESDSDSKSDKENDKTSDKTISETSAITIEKTTIQTTKSTTAEVEKTTVTKKQDETEESEIYLIYLAMLNEMDVQFKREYGNMPIPYYRYYLYDINHDGIYELLVHVGESEADAVISICSVDENGELIDLGEIGGGHTILVEKDGNLCTDLCHRGYQLVEKIIMMEDLGSWIITKATVSEEDNLSDYKSYGTVIKGYDISDTSAIEVLCPKELLEDKPYVEGYVETYALSGRDGSKIRLYLNGDFSNVSVQIQNQEYTSEVEFYSKEDFGDYIEMNFNPFAQPPSVAYVTPYNDAGVAGDTITCNIPTDTSGTIQTGGMSYPIEAKKGQINCHGGTVAGFTTDYVVNGGAVGKVRNSLGDTWHVTAKNACDNYGVTWYELWDSDDGDYYDWVDESFIDFY